MYFVADLAYRVFHVFSLGLFELERVELDTVIALISFALYSAYLGWYGLADSLVWVLVRANRSLYLIAHFSNLPRSLFPDCRFYFEAFHNLYRVAKFLH